MRPNPLCDTCTCTNFEARVIQVLCFKIHVGVCFKICVGTRVTQMFESHIPCVGPGLIKFAFAAGPVTAPCAVLESRKQV
jgi:hypothetical protein